MALRRRPRHLTLPTRMPAIACRPRDRRPLRLPPPRRRRTDEPRVAHRRVLAVAATAGCASAPKDAGFGDVRRTVHRADAAARGVGPRRPRSQPPDDAAVCRLLQDELTADRAVQIAFANNRDVQATLEELGIARAELIAASTIRNPLFHAEMRFPATPPTRSRSASPSRSSTCSSSAAGRGWDARGSRPRRCRSSGPSSTSPARCGRTTSTCSRRGRSSPGRRRS